MTHTPEARMTNPAYVLSEAGPAIQGLVKATRQGGVSEEILELVHLRASQINGCGFCVDYGVRNARKAGVSDEKLFAVSAWRESPHFSDEERAALALAEHATRIADSTDAVPDPVWDAAADHFDEKQLASIVLMISLTNFFNRLNVTVRQPAGVAI
ncbi:MULTISPECIES: carboxymuconolactone decarboxylase family protein [Streptomyces]|uniref:Alkyl hydroperoxide reductase AhpD n=2 Tax=Streptomyces cinereoruber TaxID=67260 RepID=A0AAV4KSH1_9ACTN|nr:MULTISPECIES: carboxymuconolactone decarboxylase family protein [Streptomyces]KYG55571.1 alkylhydroperoxidase [Streptomyces sp. WAC04657]MBB4160029.1 AhpD family alkylhydroperoxidase [Streptomyces cinereoruber]NIH60967.1 AhpD family alkylhydroperoxidase [Streptomyces cinereoruber]GGR37642.1 alkyl hydroperoxide reductase AhpD [Streptomyces cinereoruber]